MSEPAVWCVDPFEHGDFCPCPTPSPDAATEPSTGALRAAFLSITHAIATKRSMSAAEVRRLLEAVADEARAASVPPALDAERLLPLRYAVDAEHLDDYTDEVQDAYRLAAAYAAETPEPEASEG